MHDRTVRVRTGPNPTPVSRQVDRMFPLRPRTPHRTMPYPAVPLLTVLFLLCAVPAHAEKEHQAEGKISAAEYFADLLKEEEPEGAAIVIHDSVVGEHDPTELSQDLRDAFDRLEVPYYVVASAVPSHRTHGDDFLAAVQDRVAEPGLYVLLKPNSSQVYAISSGVDLPVEDAADVLLREGAFTHDTPMDVRADTFVDTLQAPDLDERAKLSWYQTSPIFWWWDRYVQGVNPNSYGGPARLGETAAFVMGSTLTLTVILLKVRTRRRVRAEEAGHLGKLPRDRALAVGGTLALVVGAVVMISSLTYLNTASLSQDTPDAKPLPPEEAPYVASTVRVDRIADALRKTSLYVDPLAQDSTEELAEVAERLEASELPVYAAVVPMSMSDESEGEPEILAHALHHVMGEDGVFVVVDSSAGKSPRVDAALFGVAHEEEGGSWEAQREVTGHQDGLTTAQALDRYLDLLEEATIAPGEGSDPPHSVEHRSDPTPEPSQWSRFFSEGFYWALLLAGPFTALVLFWGARAAVGVFRPLRAAPGRALRPRADRAVRRASKALRATPDNHPGRPMALQEIDAALAVLAGEPDELDLVGATVLADRATRRLNSDPDTTATADLPVCGINPLHGPAVAKARGSTRHLCAACAALPSNVRPRATLRVAVPSGGRRPHHELKRRWVTTGYGATDGLDVEEVLKESDAR